MGCDIHLYCEKIVTIKGKEFWWCCDIFTLNEGFDFYEDEKILKHHSIYSARDYELFGILAGVRNRSVKPIDKPRGLPDNISNYVRNCAYDWEGDAHSHSYFTAEELFAYDKKHPGTPLHLLVKKVKKTMRREFNIWKDYSKEEKKRLYAEYASKFRIVFWYDN